MTTFHPIEDIRGLLGICYQPTGSIATQRTKSGLTAYDPIADVRLGARMK